MPPPTRNWPATLCQPLNGPFAFCRLSRADGGRPCAGPCARRRARPALLSKDIQYSALALPTRVRRADRDIGFLGIYVSRVENYLLRIFSRNKSFFPCCFRFDRTDAADSGLLFAGERSLVAAHASGRAFTKADDPALGGASYSTPAPASAGPPDPGSIRRFFRPTTRSRAIVFPPDRPLFRIVDGICNGDGAERRTLAAKGWASINM
ncbi:hypothetical protein EVAR_36595_1 [Eumeta japonica]|uniref:Uncharacterized protein n=1 Tax=Eumeta variegata TaxID=151549 RepID=A0A4C1XRY5_EUMVA|nr:hypothetical protein EVAR_36595_1 [Eumeta japonica]